MCTCMQIVIDNLQLLSSVNTLSHTQPKNLTHQSTLPQSETKNIKSHPSIQQFCDANLLKLVTTNRVFQNVHRCHIVRQHKTPF